MFYSEVVIGTKSSSGILVGIILHKTRITRWPTTENHIILFRFVPSCNKLKNIKQKIIFSGEETIHVEDKTFLGRISATWTIRKTNCIFGLINSDLIKRGNISNRHLLKGWL
jgi:hypothetical protein